MDGSFEFLIRFALEQESVGELFRAVENVGKEMDVALGGAKEANKTIAAMTIATERQLEAAIKNVQQANMLLKARKGDLEAQRQARELVEEALATVQALASENVELLDIRQMVRINQLHDSISKVLDDINKANRATSEWRKNLDQLGLGRVYDQMKKLATIAPWVSFWAKAVGQAIQETKEWRFRSSEMYGTATEMAEAVRNVARSAGILTKEAQDAYYALRDMGIANREYLDSVAEVVGVFIADTGVSAKVATRAAKQYEVMGFSVGEVEDAFNGAQAAISRYALSAEGAGHVQEFINKNSRLLMMNVGGTTEAFIKASDKAYALAGALHQAGMDASETASIFQKLTDDIFQYTVAIGPYWASIKDPATDGMLAMMANAEAMNKIVQGIDARFRPIVTRELFNLTPDQIKRFEEGFAKFAEQTGHSANELRRMLRSSEGLPENLEKQFDAFRRLHDPGYAYGRLMDDLRIIFVNFVGPVVEGIATIARFVGELMRAAPWLREVIKWAVVAVTTFVVLKGALKGLMLLKTIVPWFQRMAEGIKQTGAAAQKTAGVGIAKQLQNLGKGIVGFFKEFENISWSGVGQALGVLALTGVVLIGLAYAAYWLPTGRLFELGAALVAFGISLRLMSAALEKGIKGIWMGILAMAALGVAIVLLGYGASKLPPDTLTTLAGAFIAISASMYVLGRAGEFLAKHSTDLIKATGALLIFSVAVAALAFALRLAQGVGWETLIIMTMFLIAVTAVFVGMVAVLTPFIAVIKPIAIAFAIFAAALIGVAFAALMFSWAIQNIIGAFVLLAEVITLEKAMAVIMVIGAIVVAVFTLGAALPLAALAMISMVLLGIGLTFLLSAVSKHAGAVSHFAGFAPAMKELAEGVGAIVKSPYVRFVVASRSAASGLRRILGAIAAHAAAINALPAIARHFSNAMWGIYEGMHTAAKIPKVGNVGYEIFSTAYWMFLAGMPLEQTREGVDAMVRVFGVLSKGIASFSGAGHMVKIAREMRSALVIIERSMATYAWWIDKHARNIAESISRVVVSVGALRLTGLDEMVKTSAIVTVKTELEDKRREELARSEQLSVLEGIRSSMFALVDAVKNISVGGGDVGRHLETLRELLNTWLPEIAESDRGLASTTNQWHSGLS